MSLRFGTAGLRATVGVGEDQMNVLQVTSATAGLAAWLVQRLATEHLPHPAPHDEAAEGTIGADMYGQDGPLRVAVGYDARYGSHTFACTAAEVFAGAGFDVHLLPTPTPTPVMPWLVKSRQLDAGVQITASHNPASDNGYKVYLAGGAQLVSPFDKEIEAHIAAVGDPLAVPRVAVRPGPDPVRRYIDTIVDTVTPAQGDMLRVNNERANLSVVFTAMHGVGGRAMNQALQAAGFARCAPVIAQHHPDPTFATVSFPNPEEPGATDLLLETGRQADADLLIALDPDADRCAVGIRAGEDYRMLRGDELGPLLATRLVPPHPQPGTQATTPAPVVATTVVSSQLLSRIAADRGWDYQETLTGFKNLARAADGREGPLVFAYEEAIGTCPFPDIVADKDGIATAVVACVWAAELKAQGSSLGQELEQLYRTYGVHAGTQVSVRTTDPAGVVDALTHHAPTELAGLPISASPLAGTAGVVLRGQGPVGAVRVIARASGTEPKAKFYVEVTGTEDSATADALLQQVEEELRATLAGF